MTPENYKNFKEWIKDRHLLYLRGSQVEGEKLDDRWRNSIKADVTEDILTILNAMENLNYGK